MKKTSLLIVLLLVAACSNGPFREPYQMDNSASWRQLKIEDIAISLLLPKTAEISLIKSGSPSFRDGKRIVVFSMPPRQFEEVIYSEGVEAFFLFTAFAPIPWDASIQDWLALICPQGINIEKTFHNTERNYVLYQIKTSCSPLKYFLIVNEDLILRFEAGDDTRDYDAIWNILSNVQFEESQKSSPASY